MAAARSSHDDAARWQDDATAHESGSLLGGAQLDAAATSYRRRRRRWRALGGCAAAAAMAACAAWLASRAAAAHPAWAALGAPADEPHARIARAIDQLGSALSARGIVWRRTAASRARGTCDGLVADWPSRRAGLGGNGSDWRAVELLGPSSRAARAAAAGTDRARLYAALLARLAAPGPPTGTPCGRLRAIARFDARWGRSPLPAERLGGGGAVACADARSGELRVRPAERWGDWLAARKWCGPASRRCVDATRPACAAAPAPAAADGGGGGGAALPVYFYAEAGGSAHEDGACETPQCRWLHRAASRGRIRLVDDPDAACVFVHSQRFQKGRLEAGLRPLRWAALPHWTAAGAPGRNHVLLMPSCAANCDWPQEGAAQADTADALVAAVSAWAFSFRPGFDFVLPMWSRALRLLLRRSARAFAPRDRPLLLAFRGHFGGRNAWADARAIAAAYSHEPAAGVLIETLPRAGAQRRARGCSEAELLAASRAGLGSNATANASVGAYDELLLSAAYGFAPSGGGPYSFRFVEVLAAGGVPVVTHDVVLPYEGLVAAHRTDRARDGALDWDACVVRVSKPELRALGDVLRALAPPRSAAFRARRAACADIWHRVFLGGGASDERAFEAAAGDLFWRELQGRYGWPTSAVRRHNTTVSTRRDG